jgi:hypothetical protein
MNVKVVMHDLIKLPSVTSLQTSSLSLGKFDLFIDSYADLKEHSPELELDNFKVSALEIFIV